MNSNLRVSNDVNIRFFWMHFFQQVRERLKTLEEHVEAERASHLETKFNSEIVQVYRGNILILMNTVDENVRFFSMLIF